MKSIRVVWLVIIVVVIISVLAIIIAVTNPRVEVYLVSMQRTEYVDEAGQYQEYKDLIRIELQFEIVNRGRVNANYAVFSDDFERAAISVNNDTHAYPNSVKSSKTDHCRITYLLEDNEETKGLNLNSFFVFYRKNMADPTIVERYRWARWFFGILGVRYNRIMNI